MITQIFANLCKIWAHKTKIHLWVHWKVHQRWERIETCRKDCRTLALWNLALYLLQINKLTHSHSKISPESSARNKIQLWTLVSQQGHRELQSAASMTCLDQQLTSTPPINRPTYPSLNTCLVAQESLLRKSRLLSLKRKYSLQTTKLATIVLTTSNLRPWWQTRHLLIPKETSWHQSRDKSALKA
jgi:hypothetical protein